MKQACLIDGSSYLFRAYYAIQPLSNSKGFPTHVVMGFTSMLLKVMDQLKPDMISVVWDSPKPSFRAEKYEDYKADRDECPEDLAAQIPVVKEVVTGLGIHQCHKDGFEADDLIATWARKLRKDHEVVIVSSDKDLTQLVDDRVVMWDTMRDKRYAPKDVEEKYGVPPEQMRDLLALMGDNSDNIPGVKGIGPKTATTLLKEYGSLAGVYKALPKMKESRTRSLLQDGKKSAELSYELVGLVDNVDINTSPDDLHPGKGEPEKLRTLLLDLELRNLAARLEKLGKMGASGGEGQGLRGGSRGDAEVRPGVSAEPVKLKVADRVDAHAVETAEDFLSHLTKIGADPLALYLHQSIEKGSVVPLGLAAVGSKGGCWMSLKMATDVQKRALFMGLHTSKREFVSYDVKALARMCLQFDHGPPKFVDDVLLQAYLVDSNMKHEPESMSRLFFDQVLTDDSVWKDSLTANVGGYLTERAALLPRLCESFSVRVATDGLEKLYRDVELPLSLVLAEMEECGILIDRKFLKDLQKELDEEARSVEKKIYDVAGLEFTIQSPKQLADVLFGKLGLPTQKKTKTGFSTDVDVLEKLAPLHPLPAHILEYREIMKLKSTYVDALLEVADDEDRVHTTFNQTLAVTGRLSSSDPNLQNIPIRTERGRRIRQAFCATEGNALVIGDYSQIELRLMAHYSQDPRMLEAFKQNEDIHSRTASEVFKVDPKKVSKEHRRIAKAINFGLIYGQTAFGLSQSLGITPQDAKTYIEGYFKTYARVKECMDNLISEARRKGYAETLMGRRRYLPDLKSRNRMNVQFAERNAINTPLQGSAADIIKKAMVDLHRALAKAHPSSRLVLQVHDELIVETPKNEARDVAELMKETMSSAFPVRVPLDVDVEVGPNWGAKE